MNYNNDKVRRRERLLDEERAIELLRTGEYGMLSMVEQRDGSPAGYGIPLNYVWDGGDALYFHCAIEGHKSVAIADNPMVSFCIVGIADVIANKFTAAYESIIIRGRARVGLSREERMRALELLLDKLSPNDKEIGMKYAEKSFHRTEIIRMDIEEISGKTKRVQP